MVEKYLYFRSQAADASDNDANDSVCYPASSLVGMAPGSTTTVVLRFRPLTRGTPPPSVLHADNLDNNDTVTLTVAEHTQATTMKAITNAIVGENFPSFLVIANDDSDATEYLTGSTITSCTIGTKADYAESSGTDAVSVAAAGITLDSSTNIELNADSGTVNFKDASASLGTITSAGYTGNVVGNVTGNVSGTAATVTTAAQPNITTLDGVNSIGVTGSVLDVDSYAMNMIHTSANLPTLNLVNKTNDAGGPNISLANDRTSGGTILDGVDSDVLGNIYFKGYDDGSPSQQNYALIRAIIHDATATEESGRLDFKVAAHDGTLTTGLYLSGGDGSGKVDVHIGANGGIIQMLAQALYLGALPTSDPGNVGQVWRSGADLKISI